MAVNIKIEKVGTSIVLQITETNALPGTEWFTKAADGNTIVVYGNSISGETLQNGVSYHIPKAGKISYQAKLESGTGTTIQTRLGKAGGWLDNTIDDIGKASAAAGYINNQTPILYRFAPGQTPILHGNSSVNSGVNNTIVTLITIEPVN